MFVFPYIFDCLGVAFTLAASYCLCFLDYYAKGIAFLTLAATCIIAAIVNDTDAKVPGANDVIESDDRLILILEKEKIGEVAAMFR